MTRNQILALLKKHVKLVLMFMVLALLAGSDVELKVDFKGQTLHFRVK
jgi:hypothetical protein